MKDKYKQEIIEKYKHALVNDYFQYIKVVDELNNSIPIYLPDFTNMTLFDYPTFCRSFLSNLNKELDNHNIYTVEVIQLVFQRMIAQKISENLGD